MRSQVQDFCQAEDKDSILPQPDEVLLAPVNGTARNKVRRNGRDSKKQKFTPRRTIAAGTHW
jgi:hypothetical protein